MNKDMFNTWMAKAGERKISIAVAAICTVVILGSLFWPASKPQHPVSAVKTTVPPTPAFTPAAPKPAPAPTTAPVPASRAPAAPASAPAPAAPSTMEQELAAKPLFPAATKPQTKPAPTPAPKPAPKPVAPAPTVKPVTPTAQPRAIPVSSIPSGYYVQLGSFKNRDGAETLAKKAAAKHWSAYVAPRPNGLHAVWIGPYRNRNEVEQAKQKLSKELGISGFVVHAP